MIAEYQSNTWGSDPLVWKKSYIHAGSRLLSTFTNNGAGSETLEFQHPDRLGTKLVTNNSANTSFEQSTLPFGTNLDAETTGTTNQRFTSYDRSTVAQLDYAVNRSYSSGTGRFTSVDPIGMGATNLTNPQSMNMYAYVGNNPVDFVDPSGLFMANPDIGTFTVNVTAEVGGGVEAGLMALLWNIMFQSLMDLPVAPVDSGSGGGGNSETADDKRSENDKKCDEKLAKMFGAEGSIVGSVYDPPTLKGGTNPDGMFRPKAHSAEVGIIHLYTNAEGTEANVKVYAPNLGAIKKIVPFPDFVEDTKGNYAKTKYDISVRVEYANGINISFNHVTVAVNRRDKRPDGSFSLGNIAGKFVNGKITGGEGVGYNHTHIIFSRINKKTGGREKFDPRKEYCKEFGF